MKHFPLLTLHALMDSNNMWKVSGNVVRRVTSSSWSRTTAVGVASSCRTCVPFLPSDAPSQHNPSAANRVRPAAAPITAFSTTTLRRKSTAASVVNDEEVTENVELTTDGYLGKILNAKVYDAAIETELQHAKNLSEVRFILLMKKSY